MKKSKYTLDVLKYIREKLDNNLIYQIDLVFDNALGNKYSGGAIPYMFNYLKDENIKKSNNDL